jgi:predicted signal transduction protein with EAL and GGDEF domain
VSVSIGVTTSDLYERPDAARMLGDADLALYRSKEAGRSRATFFDGGEAREDRRGVCRCGRSGSG